MGYEMKGFAPVTCYAVASYKMRRRSMNSRCLYSKPWALKELMMCGLLTEHSTSHKESCGQVPIQVFFPLVKP